MDARDTLPGIKPDSSASLVVFGITRNDTTSLLVVLLVITSNNNLFIFNLVLFFPNQIDNDYILYFCRLFIIFI